MEVLEIFVCNQAEIPLKFTDKVPFLADLSVSKTHFTDKPAISSDLSVNFWPLWWGFTDKAVFLEHLSVNGSDFDKCSTCSIGTSRSDYGQSAFFCWFVRKQNAFYGQTGHFQRFVRKFLAIMMRIYGQKPLFGEFVRKTGSETSEFLRTNGHFWPFCP